MNSRTNVYRMSFAGSYPHYVNKTGKKGRAKAEVGEIIFWLTGFDEQIWQRRLDSKVDFEIFLPKFRELIRTFQTSQT